MSNYIGNGAYCYANSASMLLSSVGEKIDPGLLETIGGFSLGAFCTQEDLLFFDDCTSSPDQAISKAMSILGFSVRESVQARGTEMPVNELREALKQGPVMMGPLDMGKLVYNPNSPNLGGCDHYVVALNMKGDEICLHDPAGFPNVFLTLDKLEEAWKSEFPWSSGVYRRWWSPERIEHPDLEEINRRAFTWFKSTLTEQTHDIAAQEGRTGASAILHKAEQVRAGAIDDNEWAHYVYFALPVGARRAHDYGLFFKTIHPDLSALKYAQSRQFGECQSRLVSRNWEAAATIMVALAETEAMIEASILKME
ncbi:hypothetical protein MKX68_12420 [Paenibacillus sp. FSL M8-0212]|uniref:hypothetical protein n=1 Tax=Paenibacillus sp. FSL M8-0212 TaxID=2921618 RepID=UPI0030FC65DD